MSLILDALNRSRQDENPVPGLATHHAVEQLTAQRRQFFLWGALAVAAAIIAWLVIDRFSAPPAPEADIGAPVAELSRNIGSAVNSVTTELKARAEAAGQAQQPAPAAPAAAVAGPAAAQPAAVDAPQPTAAAASPARPAQPASAPAGAQSATPNAPAQAAAAPDAMAQDLTEPNAAPPATGAALPQPEGAAPQAAKNNAVARLYQNRDLEDVPVQRETTSAGKPGNAAQDKSDTQRTANLDRILKEAREEMENAGLEDHPAPFLSDLSQRTKDSIPTLYYQRHDYSSDSSQSSVTLNGNTVKTGGSVVPGMKVEEILPDSVVLNYQGTQFRLRALNSWVNL